MTRGPAFHAGPLLRLTRSRATRPESTGRLAILPGEPGRHPFQPARLLRRSAIHEPKHAHSAEVRPVPASGKVVDAVAVAVEREQRLVAAEAIVAEAKRAHQSRVVEQYH